jgi:hypothetical protein
MCDRFHKLPSEVLEEDVSLIRLLKIWKMGNPDRETGSGEEDWDA